MRTLAAALCAALAAGAVPVSPRNRNFGSAIKNGILPAWPAELETFAHNCTAAPCLITTIHIPSIYPDSNTVPACPWDFEHGRLRVYVDGEVTPTIDVDLLFLASVGEQGAVGNNQPADGSPFGQALFGKTARTGGIYSTMRIPFNSSIKTTLTAPPSCANGPSYFWQVTRGVEALPIYWGPELQLPDQARLRLWQTDNQTLGVHDEFSIAAAAPGMAGVVALTFMEANADDFSYLEGCFRYYVDGQNAPMFLSSGTEDYFLSASYFDEDVFIGAQSGCTYKGGNGGMAAYKIHDRDPLLFNDGFNLTIRNNEDPSCPTGWGFAKRVTGAPAANRAALHAAATGRAPLVPQLEGFGNAIVNVTAIVWAYVWPANGPLTFTGRPA